MYNPLLLFTLLMITTESVVESQKLIDNANKRPFNNSISAILVFGDSTVDPGNNNYVNTIFRSNFPPYGVDFENSIPTGRFTDGKLVTDFIASYAGIKEHVPPYLDPTLSLEELMTGVSFASAGSGFDLLTCQLIYGVICVEKQLEYFKEYKAKLQAAIGKERTETLIGKAVFVISSGTNDVVLNYYGAPFRRYTYNITSYRKMLLQAEQSLIEGLRKEGARLIAVVGLPPMGCIPIAITFTSPDSLFGRTCTDWLSSVALDYNQELQNMLKAMQNPSSPIVYADIYQPLTNMIQNPSQYGFDVVNVGCCGIGFVETTFMCNPKSLVCSNPSQYVFFDSVHPTEAAYNYIFKALRPIIDEVIKNFQS